MTMHNDNRRFELCGIAGVVAKFNKCRIKNVASKGFKRLSFGLLPLTPKISLQLRKNQEEMGLLNQTWQERLDEEQKRSLKALEEERTKQVE